MVEHIYTPILKWKKAEQGALHDLFVEQRDAIVPLFEFIKPSKVSVLAKKSGIDTPENELLQFSVQSIPNSILSNWGKKTFFADFTLITPGEVKDKYATGFCECASSLGMAAIPVINMTDDETFVKSVIGLSRKYLAGKVCLRVNAAEINKSGLIEEFFNLFIKEGMTNKDISILLDLKDNTDSNFFSVAIEELQHIEHLSDFEYVIVASGAFPKDMSKFKTSESDNYQMRDDWNNWIDSRGRKQLVRMPSFADYTIRHPIYDALAMKHRSTATIKYTTRDRWEIYKGGVGKFEDCLAYASVIRTSKIFYRARFSAGDKYIDEKGLYQAEYAQKTDEQKRKDGGTGNATSWIKAGINHHIAVVVDQLANLNG